MTFYRADEYQGRVCKLFGVWAARIKEVLPNARIEHIGSSSIPGAISKGDLDIFVGVDGDVFGAAIPVIEALGFRVKLDSHRDEALCPFEAEDGSDVGVQLVANGSKYEFFLQFRDALIKRADLLTEYNALKLSCQGFAADEYRRVKSRFVERVLGRSSREE